MSKLFDAIERIRRHEAGEQSGPALSSSARRPLATRLPAFSRRRPLFSITLFAATLLLLVAGGYLWQGGKIDLRLGEISGLVSRLSPPNDSRPAPARSVSPPAQEAFVESAAATSSPPTSVNSATIPKAAPVDGTTGSMQEFNRQGVALHHEGDHWRAIYYFEQARKAAPGAVEPLINLGVALSELGLFGPANRFFAQAHALAPEHTALGRNLEILAAAGRLESRLSPPVN